jgi:hypothetical protein
MQAIELLGSEWVFDELRKAGRLTVGGTVPGRYAGHPRPLFRRGDVQGLAAERQHRAAGPGPGWLKVLAALAQFTFEKKTLYQWVERCPALGRAIGHRRHAGTLYLSREDLDLVAGAVRSPGAARLPGNDGDWLAKGIYRDGDGLLWYGLAHLQQTYGVGDQMWRQWIRHGHQALDGVRAGGKPQTKAPLWPSVKMPHGGREVVILEDHARRILDWRRTRLPTVGAGAGAGAWLADGVYRDGEGVWVTDRWIQASLAVSGFFVGYWHRRPHPALRTNGNDGRLRRKRVPAPFKGKGSHGRVFVYSEADARRILGPGGGAQEVTGGTAGGAPAAAGLAGRGRRQSTETREVYEFCYTEYRVNGRKRSAVWAAARQAFGPRAPKAEHHVTTYANRYADRNSLPREPR